MYVLGQTEQERLRALATACKIRPEAEGCEAFRRRVSPVLVVALAAVGLGWWWTRKKAAPQRRRA
jgi:hypothetical protein